MLNSGLTHPVVAMSTKAYFGAAETIAWLQNVAASGKLSDNPSVDVVVCVPFPMIVPALDAVRGTRIRVGSQAVAASPAGNQTGEVLASLLREIGCRYAEVGHAERRLHFGETPEVVRAKVRVCLDNAIVPILCVGEPVRGDESAAAAYCVRQFDDAVGDIGDCEILVAYEPLWAIGADEPASSEHVRFVCNSLKEAFAVKGIRGRVIYGGTAGAGLLRSLVPAVDGLFLGRRAHNPRVFSEVIAEAGQSVQGGMISLRRAGCETVASGRELSGRKPN